MIPGIVASAAANQTVGGTGALLAAAAMLAGAGVSQSTGSGALAAAASHGGGAGTSGSIGSGALVAGSAAVAGLDSILGTGALNAAASAIGGAGVSGSVGIAALAAQSSTLAGSGHVTVIASFDSSTAVNTTLSNSDLTATHANTTTNSGVIVGSAQAKSAGKFYFEMTMTTRTGSFTGCGCIITTGTLTNFVTNGTNCLACYPVNGNIWSNGANSTKTLGALSNGDVIGVAIDIDNGKAWFRKAPSGNWNGDASANPATNTGGVTLYGSKSWLPAVGFGGAGTGATEVWTGNFGGASFSGTVPSGFTPNWAT